jgi:hypothetical protein
MEFQSRLKRKHLMDLISYLKTASNATKVGGEEETLEVANLNFLDDSLFLGVMPFENRPVQPKKGKKTKQSQASIRASAESTSTAVKAYDPLSARQKEGVRITQIWSSALVTQL